MTARSKGQRIKNRKIKAEKLKHRELKRLHKIVKGGQELMDVVSEVVDEKKVEDIKKKNIEEAIAEEFVAEKREEIEKISKKKNKKKIKITNDNTGKVHEFNTKTLKDQYGSYPPWLNVGNHKRKIKRRKAALRKNQFYTGANQDYCA